MNLGIAEKCLFVRVYVCNHGSDRTLGSTYTKLRTQVFWDKILVEFVNGPNSFNHLKSAAILNT